MNLQIHQQSNRVNGSLLFFVNDYNLARFIVWDYHSHVMTRLTWFLALFLMCGGVAKAISYKQVVAKGTITSKAVF